VGGIVTLLTDFGTADGYVAAMKGAILAINPAVTLVDVTHEIGPQQIRDGAFVLHTVLGHFPTGTIYLAVVDPGVGTDRAGVVVDMGGSFFVGPDNGLLSYIISSAPSGSGGDSPAARRWGDAEPRRLEDTPVPLPAGWRAVRIAESRYWLPNPSNTFHGRDIFAPVAAHLSIGEPMDRFGPPLQQLWAFEIPVPCPSPDGGLEGTVIHVDRYGNLVTNFRAADLPGGILIVEIGEHRIEGLSRSYAGHRGLLALVDGHGYLEIALSNGSALRETGLGVSTPVRVSGVEFS